jgi:hypothetical protein
MACSYGANATFAGKLEASYGTPPGGNYESLPFISTSLGSEQGPPTCWARAAIPPSRCAT